MIELRYDARSLNQDNRIMIHEFDGIRAIEPVGFLEFLQLEANARLALTDSGGGPGGDMHPGRALRDLAR